MGDASDARTQAVLSDMAARVKQLELGHRLERDIVEELFDTSSVALFRLTRSADLIYQLIDLTPSIPESKQQALREIAADLVALAGRATRDAYERGLQRTEAKQEQPSPGALDWLRRETQVEVDGLKAEWASVKRWLLG
jgi:hypothetical protein